MYQWGRCFKFRSSFYFFNILQYMFECWSTAWLKQQTVINNLSQIFITFLWNYKLFSMIANNSSNLGNASSHIRNITSHHLPEDDTKTVNIGCFLILFSSQNFWCHPMRCSDFSMIIFLELFFISGKTKVTNLNRPILV